MIAAQFLNSLAAHVAWINGKDNGVNGALAVLFCLRNRVAAGADLKTEIEKEYGNIYSHQFFVPDTRDPGFSQVLGFVDAVLDNSITDRITGGATHWAKDDTLHQERVAQVGTMSLWR